MICRNCRNYINEIRERDKISTGVEFFLHCHHEEEKKCRVCQRGEDKSPIYYAHDSPKWSPVDCKFCPECGRKLNA